MNDSVAHGAATLEDLRAVPDDRVGHLVEGVLYNHARPRTAHAELIGALHRELSNIFTDTRRGGPGGWVFLIEPELVLGADTLVPDIAGWRRERLPRVPDVARMTLAPDWVCEVLSGGTEAFDRGPKKQAYARGGVPILWYVQPRAKLIEVFRKTGEFYASVAEATFLGAEIALEPFAAKPFELGELGTWTETPDET
jgi:Uma2 family endonuclease